MTADMFQECSIADIRYLPLVSSVGVIVDLRAALQLDGGNVELLIIEGVTELRISNEDVFARPMMRTVIASTPAVEAHGYAMDLAFHPSSVMSIRGRRGIFHEGVVDEIGDTQPDLGEVSEFWGGFPDWNSPFTICCSTIVEV
ncbi:hypothetical protein HLB23_28395 [Nocardia uniformis]|uniref:Uncharacterized protein n=1 Tax=Nocardia uniformis TaxID=53432 RepID=A0A849C7K9_9NOCA|nr:hypothetical protein [Nocardia uniformis]NNH73728.1 hypothetical protein [Nocardia uniformis]